MTQDAANSLPTLVPGSIAVVIPCYHVGSPIDRVIATARAQKGVRWVIVVDDGCPYRSGIEAVQRAHVAVAPKSEQLLAEVVLVPREQNGGVGAAMVSGFRRAMALGAEVVVKIDGDGQMDPAILARFVGPILQLRADFTKGNRFYRIESLRGMPWLRLLGNAALSFMTKMTSGYWRLMDPTNGYLAIHAAVLREIPLEKLDPRYFFESDLLFRLGTVRAVIRDVPMDAVYGDETSHLRIGRTLLEFPRKHAHRLIKRLIYTYFLRSFHFASLELVLGLGLLGFGLGFGGFQWWRHSVVLEQTTPTGTVMLAAVTLLGGLQFLLAWAHFDMSQEPTEPLCAQATEAERRAP